MDANQVRREIERVWKELNQRNFGIIEEVASADYVQEWPQSGERIRGAANARAVNETYPVDQFPTMELTRVLAGENFAISEAKLDYAGTPFYGISIFELKDGKIVKETDYFAAPFEAPEWRSKLVEKM
jgi:hypothetical protein